MPARLPATKIPSLPATSILQMELPNRLSRLLVFLVAGAIVCAGCGRRPAPDDRSALDLSLSVGNGREVFATLYPVSNPSPPGVILVSAPGAERTAWAPLAVRAQRAGIMGLAIDLRRHNGAAARVRQFGPEDFAVAYDAFRAAKAELVRRGADPNDLGMIGASQAANLVLDYAVTDSQVQVVVLVSPWLEWKGIAAESLIARFGKRPSLLVATEGDSYAASSCETLAAAAPGFCEQRRYPGGAHGADIFAVSASAVEQVIHWLTTVLESAS